MINSNLESDLRTFCLTLDSTLFGDKLYQPLKYMATSICIKRKVKQYEYEDGVIEDMVSYASGKLPGYYNPKKGMAKAAIYILMSQYLLNRLIKNHNQYKKFIFIEDLEEDTLCKIIEVEIDDFELMKQTLNERIDLVNRIKNKTHRKVARQIINAINNPERFSSVKCSFTKSISKHCKVNPQIIYKVIKKMREELVESI